MDDFHEVLGAFTDLARAGAGQFRSGWLLAQLAILVAAALVAAAAAAVTRRRLDLITITLGWPWPWRLAALVLVANLGILIFMVLAAIAAFALSRMPLPSQYYLLRAAASLAAAWLVINLLAGFIRNQFVLRLVTFAAWTIAALAILDWLDPVTTALDSLFVMVGSVRLSALLALNTLAFLLFGIWAAIAVSDFIERRLSSEADLTPSIQVLIGKLARVALITVAILIVISSVGIDISALALFSGAVGVGVGFGLQKVVSNLVSGIILLADKSIKPGDVISVGDSFGWVTTMGARYTSVITRDGREHLIPNEDLITHRVLNWSHFSDNVRLDVNFSVGATCLAQPAQLFPTRGRPRRPGAQEPLEWFARSSPSPAGRHQLSTWPPFSRRTFSGTLTGFLGAGSFGAGSCFGTTAGFGITSGMSIGCDPGW